MKLIILFISLLFVQSIFAQSKLPVIKATSKTASINDGGYFQKDMWTISLKTKLDIYTSERTRKTKWVTFYTDIDSIKVKVKQGTRFNFIVLLNGKDSCETQIASAIPPNNESNKATTNDTIPFTLTPYNAIAIKAVINHADTLNLHLDVSSSNVCIMKNVIAHNENLHKVSTLQIGNSVWNNPKVHAVSTTAQNMDGRIGWNLFEGKILTIDYDNNYLIIQSKLPRHLKGYAKSELEFIHSYPCIKAMLVKNNKEYSYDYLLDNGSDCAIFLDSAWTSNQNFAAGLQVIKSSVIEDGAGRKHETKVISSPLLKIGNSTLTNIPTYVLAGENPLGFGVNILGNDLLKRFNAILDFEHDEIYLEPNKLFNSAYNKNT